MRRFPRALSAEYLKVPEARGGSSRLPLGGYPPSEGMARLGALQFQVESPPLAPTVHRAPSNAGGRVAQAAASSHVGGCAGRADDADGSRSVRGRTWSHSQPRYSSALGHGRNATGLRMSGGHVCLNRVTCAGTSPPGAKRRPIHRQPIRCCSAMVKTNQHALHDLRAAARARPNLSPLTRAMSSTMRQRS